MKTENKDVTVSIVTCTYNAAQVLQPTLDSVSCQLYDHIEHLIIDGQSTDQTMAIVNAYKELAMQRGRKVVAISEPDSGLYDAMNKGLRMASGHYIVFLNAGDRLHSAQTLCEVAKASSDGRAGVVYGQTNIIDEAGNFLRPRRLQAPERLSWRSFRQGMVVCHQAFYASTDIARQMPYNIKLRFSADVDWCIRVMQECERESLSLAYTGTTVADFMDGGMTSANHKASLMERFRVMCRYYGTTTTILLHLWFALRALFKGSKA